MDDSNPIDVHLTGIYKTSGKDHLREFMNCVRTVYMPAGQSIGDSHELVTSLCDKLPWLDKSMRFKIAAQLTCKSCGFKRLKEDSVIELDIQPSRPRMPLLDALQEFVAPHEIEGWECDGCKTKQTCVSQTLFGSFPRTLMIHRSSLSHTLDYASILVLNGNKYALGAVICFNGGHWWTYARDMPPGKSWYELNDSHVRQMTPTQFPVAGTMRMLLYFLLEN